MHIHLEGPIEPAPQRRTWRTYAGAILGILEAQFGMLTVLLFLTLLIAESIYRHSLHPGGPMPIGGPATLAGLGLLACAYGIVGVARARYKKQMRLPAGPRFYMTLTEQYLERGVPDLWQEQIQWSSLTGFTEHRSSFLLKFDDDPYWLWKKELKNEAAVAEVRGFLTARTMARRDPAVAV